jgi:hypothetical protein
MADIGELSSGKRLLTNLPRWRCSAAGTSCP